MLHLPSVAQFSSLLGILFLRRCSELFFFKFSLIISGYSLVWSVEWRARRFPSLTKALNEATTVRNGCVRGGGLTQRNWESFLYFDGILFFCSAIVSRTPSFRAIETEWKKGKRRGLRGSNAVRIRAPLIGRRRRRGKEEGGGGRGGGWVAGGTMAF